MNKSHNHMRYYSLQPQYILVLYVSIFVHIGPLCMATTNYVYTVQQAVMQKLVYLLMSILSLIICIYCTVLNGSAGLLSIHCMFISCPILFYLIYSSSYVHTQLSFRFINYKCRYSYVARNLVAICDSQNHKLKCMPK